MNDSKFLGLTAKALFLAVFAVGGAAALAAFVLLGGVGTVTDYFDGESSPVSVDVKATPEPTEATEPGVTVEPGAPTATVAEPDVPSPVPEIGPEVAWDPLGAIDAIGNAPYDDDDAVADLMTNNGASPEAVAFYRDTGLFPSGFREEGVVDVVDTFDPRRANSNDDTVLVNGSPRTLLADAIDVSSLAEHPLYTEIADAVNSWGTRGEKTFTVWGNDRWLREISTSPSGGQAFLFEVLLTDGCHVCDIGIGAVVALDFAPDGTYEGWRPLAPTGDGLDWLRDALGLE